MERMDPQPRSAGCHRRWLRHGNFILPLPTGGVEYVLEKQHHSELRRDSRKNTSPSNVTTGKKPKNAEIPIDEFLRFNPAFKPGVEPPSRAYNLLLPWGQAQNLIANVPGARLVAPSKYTVRKGETLDGIAKRHGVPSQTLAQWNGLNAKVVLKTGQQLILHPAS